MMSLCRNEKASRRFKIMKILAISGSARAESSNTALLKAMQQRAPAKDDFFVFHRLDLLPVFSPDLEGKATPQAVLDFMDMIARADGIIISSPEYVRAIPGGLKNAIDWMVSRFEVIDKPIVLAHASHRGDDMLASLKLVLSTVSIHFIEPLFLRIPLIGMSSQDIDVLLQAPEHELQIATFLRDFEAKANSISLTNKQIAEL